MLLNVLVVCHGFIAVKGIYVPVIEMCLVLSQYIKSTNVIFFYLPAPENLYNFITTSKWAYKQGLTQDLHLIFSLILMFTSTLWRIYEK